MSVQLFPNPTLTTCAVQFFFSWLQVLYHSGGPRIRVPVSVSQWGQEFCWSSRDMRRFGSTELCHDCKHCGSVNGITRLIMGALSHRLSFRRPSLCRRLSLVTLMLRQRWNRPRISVCLLSCRLRHTSSPFLRRRTLCPLLLSLVSLHVVGADVPRSSHLSGRMRTFLWLLSGLLSPRCCHVSHGLGAITTLMPYVVRFVRQLSAMVQPFSVCVCRSVGAITVIVTQCSFWRSR